MAPLSDSDKNIILLEFQSLYAEVQTKNITVNVAVKGQKDYWGRDNVYVKAICGEKKYRTPAG